MLPHSMLEKADLTIQDFLDAAGELNPEQAKRFIELASMPSCFDDPQVAMWPLDRNYCIVPDDKPGYGYSEYFHWRDDAIDAMWDEYYDSVPVLFRCYEEGCWWTGRLPLREPIYHGVDQNDQDIIEYSPICPRCYAPVEKEYT